MNGKIIEVLEKNYTTDDFNNIELFSDQKPDINFERTAEVDPKTNITLKCKRHFKFLYEKPENNLLNEPN